MAIFRRKDKDEWLGELQDIRDGALGAADGRLVEPPTGPTGPTDPTGEADDDPRPVGSLDDVDAAPAGTSPAATASEPVVAPRQTASRIPKPSPHRDRPTELWHAPIELGASTMPDEIAQEERLFPADLSEPSADGWILHGTTSGPRAEEAQQPRPETFPAADLRESSNGSTQGSADGDGDGDDAASRPRLRPPTDIFDVAPSSQFDAVARGEARTGDDQDPPERTAGLVSGPVGRRRSRVGTQRSLFGGGAGTASSEQAGPEALEVGDGGALVDERGTLRLSDRTRPRIVRSASDDSLTLDAGWCWVARGAAVPPARITLPNGVLVVPASTRALAVVEVDMATFVSVVSGNAHIEHSAGLVPLAAGSIAHVPLEGDVNVDRASADEMAADAILTRNLRMDDALSAINAVRRRSNGT